MPYPAPNPTMTKPLCIRAYLGGSFDPIHDGHLSMIQAVNTSLDQAYRLGIVSDYQTCLLPTAINPFKTQQTAIHHRLQMLTLALTSHQKKHPTNTKPIAVDLTEINHTQKNTPSYTIDTLNVLKKHHPNDILVLIMGFDSLQSLPNWKLGLKILTLANLWAFLRPNTTDDHLPQALHTHLNDQHALLTHHTGMIYLDKTPILSVSSTAIRQAFFDGKTDHLPIAKDVHDYILVHGLYRLP